MLVKITNKESGIHFYRLTEEGKVMLKFIPPLKSLPAFLAVAKHKSFSKAAEELCVTHSAISQSIRQLEDNLGLALFTRSTNRVELTPRGQTYFDEISKAFDIIQTATRQQKCRTKFLTINVPPTLGMRWVIPRLPSFQEKYPEINLRISTLNRQLQSSDFQTNQINIAIEYGKPTDWNNYYCEKIFDDSLILVGSPKLIKTKQQSALKTLLSANKCIFISSEPRKKDWETWCKAAKVDMPKQNARLYFQNTIQALSAVHNALGIMISHKPLLIDLLKEKRLLPLSDVEVIPPYEFYLICPEENLKMPEVKAFRDWLTQEIKKTNP